MSGSYSRSIFAYELERIVAPRKLVELSHVPVSLESRKVYALVESLSGVKRLPALNQGEIMTIVIKLGLGDDKRLQIYAALIALGVQRLLLEYLEDDRAWQVAEEVRESALVWLRKQRGKDPFRRIRGFGVAQEAAQAGSIDPLQAAWDAYDEGEILASLAHLDMDRDGGRAMLHRAQLYFECARDELELLPSTLHVSDEWKYWYDEVQKGLEAVEDELG